MFTHILALQFASLDVLVFVVLACREKALDKTIEYPSWRTQYLQPSPMIRSRRREEQPHGSRLPARGEISIPSLSWGY